MPQFFGFSEGLIFATDNKELQKSFLQRTGTIGCQGRPLVSALEALKAVKLYLVYFRFFSAPIFLTVHEWRTRARRTK
jgi:hypothetical protein